MDLKRVLRTAVTATVALETISLYRLRSMCPSLLDKSYQTAEKERSEDPPRDSDELYARIKCNRMETAKTKAAGKMVVSVELAAYRVSDLLGGAIERLKDQTVFWSSFSF